MGATVDDIESLQVIQRKSHLTYFIVSRQQREILHYQDNLTQEQTTLQALGQIMPLASLIRKLTGTGRMTSGFPARSAMWRYRGTPFSAAPALQTARDTPKMALAPNLAEIGTEILHFPEEIQQYQHRHGLGKVSAQHKPFTLLETTCSTSDLYNSLNTKPTYICSLFHPFPASVCLSFLAPPH